MGKTITLREANQAFSRCIREVEAGEEITITRRGEPVARIVPVRRERVLTPEQEAAENNGTAHHGPHGRGPGGPGLHSNEDPAHEQNESPEREAQEDAGTATAPNSRSSSNGSSATGPSSSSSS